MQLLGKEYFAKEETGVCVQSNEEHDSAAEALCDALITQKKRKVPAWMTATANIVRENTRHFAVAASVLVIGLAIYLNWAMYTPEAEGDGGVTNAVNGDGAVQSGAVDVLEGAEEDDYFSVSQINRQRARDEAIAVLQDVVDGAENLSDVQSEALAEIAQIAADIENEATIESLVKGKGFEACIAVISGESANVIVKTNALLPNEVAQIQEIVYETSGIVPTNVKIIEKT